MSATPRVDRLIRTFYWVGIGGCIVKYVLLPLL